MFNVWCVMYGYNGCLPDDHAWTTNRKEAESIAVSWARECRETNNAVNGSARYGFYTVGDYAHIEIVKHESFVTRAARDQYIADNFGG